MKKFPEDNLERSIVCSFLFLRFLCPALVTPGKYKIPIKLNQDKCYPKELPVYALRSLVLVSKGMERKLTKDL